MTATVREIVVAAVLLGTAWPLAAPVDVQVAGSLTRYEAGDAGKAIEDARAAGVEFAKAFPIGAAKWIAAAPGRVRARRLVAAVFILELAHIKYEMDFRTWPAFADAIEWSCGQLRQDEMPDAGERAWQYATVALAERARDWTFLVGVLYPGERQQARHLTHLGSRFPGDPRLALAKAFADYREADVDLTPARERLMASNPVLAASQPTPRETVDRAMVGYASLAADPLVGGDAEVRMAHILYLNHEQAAALEHARRAAAIGRDAAVRYQAQVLTGKILERLGRLPDAGRAYGAALELWPGGQSATLALAPWLVISGQSAQADRIVSESLAAHPTNDDDPWRLYHYGDYVRWPELLAAARKAIR